MRNLMGRAVEHLQCLGLITQGIFVATSRDELLRVVASHLTVIQRPQLRLLGAASRGRIRAALVEGAAGRRVQRVGQLADDFDLRLVRVWMDGRGRRQQRLRIRVQRACLDVFLGTDLHWATEVHHHHVVGNVLHHCQVVGNEHVGGVEFLLQVHEQVEHLGLDRHIQR